jgi:hypothetical protein
MPKPLRSAALFYIDLYIKIIGTCNIISNVYVDTKIPSILRMWLYGSKALRKTNSEELISVKVFNQVFNVYCNAVDVIDGIYSFYNSYSIVSYLSMKWVFNLLIVSCFLVFALNIFMGMKMKCVLSE